MALVFFVAVWLMVGVLLTSTVEHIMRNAGTFILPTSPLSIVDYVFFVVILALILGTMFVGKVKGVLDKFVAGGLLIFHSFPALAWILEPGLYGMFVPAGIFTLLCSPSNLLFAVPQARWLLRGVLPSSDTLAVFGFLLFLSGIAIFAVAQGKEACNFRLVFSCKASPISRYNSGNSWTHTIREYFRQWYKVDFADSVDVADCGLRLAGVQRGVKSSRKVWDRIPSLQKEGSFHLAVDKGLTLTTHS